ncbi:MAG: acyl-CoA dehydrogenase C-terminal domain-containing protein, partial [Myxococcota bacterium]
AQTDDEKNLFQGKLQAARFFFRWELPKTKQQSELLKRLDDTTLTMNPDWF